MSKLFLIIFAICLSSCQSYTHESAIRDGAISKYEKTEHSFFWGLNPDLSKTCNNSDEKLIKKESKTSVINYIVRVYTLGIYWPKNIKLQCEKITAQ